MKKYLPYLGFLTVIFIFFFRFLDGAEIFAFKDLSRYFYPLRLLMVEQVKAGAWPLWNPYIFFGMPLMASLQAGLFYPLTIIYHVLPFDLAFNYYIVIHYFLAACFMYWLMKDFKVSAYAAVFSSLAFAFSGYLLSVSNMNTSLSSVIWLPLVFMYFRRTTLNLDGNKPSMFNMNFVFLVLSFSLMFLGGEPTIIYITSFFLLFYALIFASGKYIKIRSKLLLLILFVLAAGLVAVQLFPFLELVRESNRGAVGTYDIVTIRSLPIRETLNFIFPFFFGNQLRSGGYNTVLLGSNIQDWIISSYMGILPFLFLPFAFFSKNRKHAIFFICAAAVSLILAYGKYTPIYKILFYAVPGLTLIRYPVKYIFLTTFAISVLSGLGFDALLNSKNMKKAAASISFIIFLLFLSAYSIISVYSSQIYAAIKSTYPKNLHPMFYKILQDNFQFDLQSAFFLVTLLFALFITLYAYYKDKIRTGAFCFIVLGLFAIDLTASNSSLNIPSSPSVYHEMTPNVKILIKKAGIERFYYTQEIDNLNRSVYGDDFDQGLIEAKDKLAANRLLIHGLYDTYGYESIELESHMNFYLALLKNNPFNSLKYLNMVNARYLADVKPIKSRQLNLLKHSKYYWGEVWLYENPHALPRAYVVSDYVVASSKKDAMKMLLSKDFNPGKYVVLEEDPKIPKTNNFSPAKIISYTPNEVVIGTNSAKPGLLFLSDTYFSGWDAYVDMKTAKIYRANYMFRAVVVGQGKHTVKFVYSPESFRLGAIISISSLLILLVASIMIKRNENKL